MTTRRGFCLGLAALAAERLRAAAPAFAQQASNDGPAPSPAPVRHYEYVVQDGRIMVYDADAAHALARTSDLPGTARTRGAVASAASDMLYVSHGNTGHEGSMLKYDLVADRLVWDRVYPYGVDSMAITPDGERIYLPVGGWAGAEVCLVIDANGGAILDEVPVGPVPHNSLCGPSGAFVYVGASSSPYLHVIETAANRGLMSLAPLA
jgi:DNA-binding beta-propeller fold protein YncE